MNLGNTVICPHCQKAFETEVAKTVAQLRNQLRSALAKAKRTDQMWPRPQGQEEA